MEYCELMKDIRFENDMTQKDVAKILGIARSTYNEFELQYDIIPLKYLIAFCDYFDLSIDYILGFSKTRKYDDLKKGTDKKRVGFNIRKVRRENKMKQIELAPLLNIANTALSNYEKGRYLISTASLYTLCTIYGISADYILNRTENKYIDIKKKIRN